MFALFYRRALLPAALTTCEQTKNDPRRTAERIAPNRTLHVRGIKASTGEEAEGEATAEEEENEGAIAMAAATGTAAAAVATAGVAAGAAGVAGVAAAVAAETATQKTERVARIRTPLFDVEAVVCFKETPAGTKTNTKANCGDEIIRPKTREGGTTVVERNTVEKREAFLSPVVDVERDTTRPLEEA